MVGKGWHKEPWRHSLAAKGVPTGPAIKPGYFQQQDFADVSVKPKEDFSFAGQRRKPAVDDAPPSSSRKQKGRGDPLSPETIERKIKAESRIKRFQEEQAKEGRAGTQALRAAQSGDFTNVKQALASPDVSDAEKTALRSELNRQAVQLTQAGLDVPESVEAELTAPTKTQIKAIKEQQDRAAESGFARTTREVGRRALEGAEKKARRTEGEVLSEQAAEKKRIEAARKELEGEGGPFPFASLGDNVFLGDGEKGIGSDEDNGSFDFITDPTVKTSPLSSAVVPQEKFAGVDFGMGNKEKPFSEKLAEEVESLWSARRELGKVDRSPLQKGEMAFKQGDREKLIEAINEQEFQIKQQESRWKLVEQTRQLVESSQNRQLVFSDKATSMFSFGMFSSGADKLADETRKINKVKESVKQGADEARARSANLRGKLQRLDSTVPPEESLPKEEVTVFKQPISFSETFGELFKNNGEMLNG
jgi:hypothetical protein